MYYFGHLMPRSQRPLDVAISVSCVVVSSCQENVRQFLHLPVKILLLFKRVSLEWDFHPIPDTLSNSLQNLNSITAGARFTVIFFNTATQKTPIQSL
jgi:hypothetical protein